jgi:hypothetical protein
LTWWHVVSACAIACIATTLNDWFFFGIVFHDKYSVFPEVWRRAPGTDEKRTVTAAMLIGFVTPIGYLFMKMYRLIAVPIHWAGWQNWPCRVGSLFGFRASRLLL